VKKCYGCGDNFAEKFRQPPHHIVVKHVDRRQVHRDDNTGALVYSTDFTNTYYHPSPVHIMPKNRASTKPGTWNIPEHPGTFQKIPEHPGTGQIITK